MLAISPRLTRTRARWRLALFLLGLGVLLLIFTAIDAGWVPFSETLRVTHDAIALLIPALLLDYLCCATGGPAAPRWVYVLAPLFLVAALAGGDAFLSWFGIGHIVVIELMFAVAATLVLYRARKRLAVWPRHLVVLLGGWLAVQHLWARTFPELCEGRDTDDLLAQRMQGCSGCVHGDTCAHPTAPQRP